MTAQPRSQTGLFNLNSILLTIIMALSGWTLKEVIALGKDQAATGVRVDMHGDALHILDDRIKSQQLEINTLRYGR